MNTKTKQFKALQKKWYGKLKSQGFEDIEQEDGNLKVWSSYFTVKDRTSSFEAKQTYYRLAGQFFYDHKFKNNLEKEIWKLHSDGVSILDIVDVIKGKGIKIYKYKVQNILKDLMEIMMDRVKHEQK